VSHLWVNMKEMSDDSGSSVTECVGSDVYAMLTQPFKHRV